MSDASSVASEPLVTPRDRRSDRMVWWLVAAVLCAWFLTLAARHLLRSDEGRYAEIAREMFASGDWVTIRYNDLKYFEKPPFHLWLTAIAYHVFGVGDWQARLWVAISGAIGLLVTMWAARRWFGPRVGLLSGLVLLATPAWNIGSHFNSLDMSVSGALACVLAGVLLAQHPLATPKSQRAWMWFAWAAMAVAILTKGLIGIALPGLVLVVYTLVARDWAVWRRLHLVSGALLMLAVAAPWFVLVSLRNPEFAQFFFIHEHWQRYTSTVHQRGAPVWYFVPQLLAGFLPWLGLTLRIGAVVRHEPRGAGFRPALWLAVWAAAIFVFFSLSSSKLPGYIIPIYPALAVLAALALDKLDARAWGRQLIGALVLAAIGVLASPLVGRLPSSGTSDALLRDYAPWIGAACVLAIAGLGLARHLNRPGHLVRSITAFSLTLFAATTVAIVGHETLGRSNSGVDLVAPMRALLTPEMPIYSVRMLDHTLPFYLQRSTIMVEAPDELEFGTQQEPQKWLPTLAAFVTVWSSGRPALAIMSHDTYASLLDQKVPMVPVATDRRRVVVANFTKPSP
jgi:4-amino-4-deoxy-L-arabinose transferase-like glycosyltransferase